MRPNGRRMLLIVLILALTSTALANTWYVNGVSGSNNNNCLLPTTACKTIKHAISLASSGDTIMVAAATYTENLTIGISLKVIGSGARTTIVDGGGVLKGSGGVVSIGAANVAISGMTLRNGHATHGGGIANGGILTLNNSAVTGNRADAQGGGILNYGTLKINRSTISGNATPTYSCLYCFYYGGGIFNSNGATTIINNSTISGNSAGLGGAIWSGPGTLRMSNITVAANSAIGAGGILVGGTTTLLQNSIVAKNSGGNCSPEVTSKGYNLSSDGSCNFHNTGDLNNTNPLLGPLQNNGGPTQTMALPSGSPAIDAGNPSGCTNSNHVLLKTDQRGYPRPNTEDTGGCDMGAFERQSD